MDARKYRRDDKQRKKEPPQKNKQAKLISSKSSQGKKSAMIPAIDFSDLVVRTQEGKITWVEVAKLKIY